jgi:hypothetical protein
VDKAVEAIMRAKSLLEFARSLSKEEREWLAEAVEDPDTPLIRERLPLMHRLVEQNLIMDDVYFRQEYLWIDQINTKPQKRNSRTKEYIDRSNERDSEQGSAKNNR